MSTHEQTTGPNSSPTMAGIVERNIQALLAKQQEEEKRRSLEERVAGHITRFAGNMRFVYLHLLLFGLWIAVNLGWTPALEFDPSLVTLAMFASVEAIFLSTFVLITQNRMQRQADRRADLDLHVSLLAEHEITRLITLVTALAERTGIDTSPHPELPELKRDVAPEQVLDKIEHEQRTFRSSSKVS